MKTRKNKNKRRHSFHAFICIHLHIIPGDGNVDFLAVKCVVESLAESGPLEDDGGNQEVNSHGTVAVLLKERHQESETDEHHDVHILEH